MELLFVVVAVDNDASLIASSKIAFEQTVTVRRTFFLSLQRPLLDERTRDESFARQVPREVLRSSPSTRKNE